MTLSNQFEIEEANLKSLTEGKIVESDINYVSPYSWGDECIATMDDWSQYIPETYEQSQLTGYGEWFNAQDNFEKWEDYRDHLLSELIEIVIVTQE